MSANNGWSFSNRQEYSAKDLEKPEPLVPGVYKVKITEAEPKLTSTNKASVRAVIEAISDYDGNDLPGRFKKCFATIVVATKTQAMVHQAAHALGIDPPETDGFEDVERFANDMLGLEAYARINNKKGDEGGIFNDFKRFLTEEAAAEQAATRRAEAAE